MPNNIYSIKREYTGDAPALSLDEVKAFIHVAFDDDDSLITRLINECTAAIESFCNISISMQTITLLGDFLCETELPHGPLESFTSVEVRDWDGNYTDAEIVDDYVIDGDTGEYARYIPRRYGRQRLVYDTGMDPIPDNLKLAIKNEIQYRYEFRGDQPTGDGLCAAAEKLASKFRRVLWV